MQYPNLLWAVAQFGSQSSLARAIECSESRLSRCLSGWAQFTPEEKTKIAQALGFSTRWLFRKPKPPGREASNQDVSSSAESVTKNAK